MSSTFHIEGLLKGGELAVSGFIAYLKAEAHERKLKFIKPLNLTRIQTLDDILEPNLAHVVIRSGLDWTKLVLESREIWLYGSAATHFEEANDVDLVCVGDCYKTQESLRKGDVHIVFVRTADTENRKFLGTNLASCLKYNGRCLYSKVSHKPTVEDPAWIKNVEFDAERFRRFEHKFLINLLVEIYTKWLGNKKLTEKTRGEDAKRIRRHVQRFIAWRDVKKVIAIGPVLDSMWEVFLQDQKEADFNKGLLLRQRILKETEIKSEELGGMENFFKSLHKYL